MSFSLPFNPFLTHTTSVAYCSTPLSLSRSLPLLLPLSLSSSLSFALELAVPVPVVRTRDFVNYMLSCFSFLSQDSKRKMGVCWGGRNWTRNHQQHAPNSCVDHKTTHVHCGKLQAVTCAIWYAMRCSALLAMCFVEVLYQKGLV